MNLKELAQAEAKAKREALELAMLQHIRALKLEGGMEREHDSRRRGWRFDFAYPSIKVALEVEGGVFQQGRHTTGAGFTADVEKYNAAALDGWLVLRATAAHVKSGKAIQWLATALGKKRLGMLERTRKGKSNLQVIVRDMAALIFFVKKAPRKVNELCELSGQHPDKVRRTLDVLVEEGLIDKSEKMSTDGRWRQSYTFTWHEEATAGPEPRC
jgi:very-short-patch-repair endonuclease